MTSNLLRCFVAVLLPLSVHAQSSTHGDVTSRLTPLGNPLVDFGYRTAVVSQQTASTPMQDVVVFQNALRIAYGDSGGGGGSKLALFYDLPKGLWWFDNDESQRWDEEQPDHFRIQGGELFLHSYDGSTPGNQLYIRDAAGWRVIDTGRGDHMRDTYRIGDRIWIQDATVGQAFPGMWSAPAANPSGAFTRFVQTAPTGSYTDVNSFLSERMFEFKGMLYAASAWGSFYAGKAPWMIRYDPATPGAVWEVAQADPLTFFPAGHFGSSTAPFVSAIYENEVVMGKFSTDAPGDPARELLIFPNARKRTDNDNTTSALWVASGITDGERRLIPLTGLPTNSNTVSQGRLIRREGKVYAAFSQTAAFGDTERRNKLWVYELTDVSAVDTAAAWTLRFTAFDLGLHASLVDFAGGKWFLGKTTSYASDGTTVANPGYSGPASFHVFDPANSAPVVTRTAPVPAATTFAQSIALGASLTVTVSVSDADAGDTISAVRLYSEAQEVGLLTNTSGSTWSGSWTPMNPGLHRLCVVAEDSRGAKGNWGRLVNLTVTNAAPSVSITAPAANESVNAAQPVFTVNASDADSLATNLGSRIARVVWRLNGDYLGESSVAPFSFTWSTPQQGTHTLTAQAFDTDGGSVTSAAVSFSYTPATTPPGGPNETALAHETFVYPRDAALASRAGGAGWSAAWAGTTTPQNFFIAPESLAYVDAAGDRLATSGGRLQLTHPTATTGIQRVLAASTPTFAGLTETLNSAAVLGADGSTVYVSFLVRIRDPRSGNYQIELRNNAGTNPAVLRFSQDYRAGRLNNSTTVSNNTSLGPTARDVETKLIVLKCSFGSANADTVRVFLNPTLATEPVTAQATLTGQSFAFDRLFIGDGGTTGWSDGREMSVDEIRVGSTWAQIAPISQTSLTDAPSVLEAPQDQNLRIGAKAIFTVLADGKRPFTYQWRKDGVAISGATASSYELWSVQSSDAGRYDVIITNAHGSSTASAAQLAIASPAAPNAPAVLGFTSVPATSVPLAWRVVAGAASYTLARASSSAGPYSDIASGLTSTTYEDFSAPANTAVFYQVRAVSVDGASLPSPRVGASTSGVSTSAITSPPAGTTFAPLQNVTLTGTGVNLVWNVSGAATTTGNGGSISFTVPATATNGQSVNVTLTGDGGVDTRSYSIVDATPAITTTSLAQATIGASYSATLTASGGDGTLSWALTSGTLPSGITFNAGVLSGSAASGTAGSYPLTFTVTDADGDAVSASLTLTVVAGGAGPTVKLLAWDFDDSLTKATSAPASTTTNSAVQSSTGTSGPGVTISANSNVNLDAVGLTGVNSATFDASDYLGWSLTPASGTPVNLQRMVFGLWQNDIDSVATFRAELRVSTDGFATHSVLSLTPSPLNLPRTNLAYNTGASFETSLSSIPALQNITSSTTVSFRLHLWGMSTAFKNTGLGKIGAAGIGDDLFIEGTVGGAQTPFQSWASSNGLSGPAADPAADPDGDGLGNFAEYALGSSPGSGSMANLPASSLNGSGEMVFSFFRARSDVSYIVEWSSDLLTWPPAQAVNASGAAGVIVQVPDPSPGAGKRFARLRMQ